jgi:hypothetical protein
VMGMVCRHRRSQRQPGDQRRNDHLHPHSAQSPLNPA